MRIKIQIPEDLASVVEVVLGTTSTAIQVVRGLAHGTDNLLAKVALELHYYEGISGDLNSIFPKTGLDQMP